MSYTPRTDSAAYQYPSGCPKEDRDGHRFCNLLNESRQLERELEKSNRHKKWLISILQKVTDYEPARHQDLSRAYEALRTIEEEDMK